MIEKIVRDYLVTQLSVSVYTEMPVNPPEEFVLISRTGGGGSALLRESVIAIQSYAGSLAAAAALNDDVVETMLGAISLKEISAVTLNSDYNFTDTTKRRHRYQAVFDIYYMEE